MASANSINWNNLVLCVFFCEEFMEGNKIQINTEKAEGHFLLFCEREAHDLGFKCSSCLARFQCSDLKTLN